MVPFAVSVGGDICYQHVWCWFWTKVSGSRQLARRYLERRLCQNFLQLLSNSFPLTTGVRILAT